MILQRLISEATKIPDLSESVNQAIKEFNQVSTELGFSEIEILNGLILRPHECENIHRRKVNLKVIESALVKAKHAVVDDDEDFV